MDIKKINLPKDFPENLLKTGFSLESIGINEMAWKYCYALEVIEFLSARNHTILGGDVYALVDGQFTPTYDNWYYNEDFALRQEENILSSKNKAISYIDQYYKTNGDNFFYVIVYDIQ